MAVDFRRKRISGRFTASRQWFFLQNYEFCGVLTLKITDLCSRRRFRSTAAKKLIPYAHFPWNAVARCGVKMQGVSVAIWMMQAQRLSLLALLLRDDVGTVLRTGLYLQFDNAIHDTACRLAVDQVAAGLRGVSVGEENALGSEIAVIQTKLLLPRAAMTR